MDYSSKMTTTIVAVVALLALIGLILGAVGVHKASKSITAVTGPAGAQGVPGPAGPPGSFPTGSAFLATIQPQSNVDNFNRVFQSEQGALLRQFDLVDTTFSTPDAVKQYDSTTGIYTIPQDGYYAISYSLNAQGYGAFLGAAINVNGVAVRSAGSVMVTDGAFCPVNDTAIVKCAAGDKVQLTQNVLILAGDGTRFVTFLWGESSFSVVFLRP